MDAGKRLDATLFLASYFSETVVIDNHPSPISVIVEPFNASAVKFRTSTFRVGRLKFCDRLPDQVDWSIRAPGNGFVRHVHHTIAVRENQHIHEGEAKLRVLYDAAVVNLREDFSEHPASRC